MDIEENKSFRIVSVVRRGLEKRFYYRYYDIHEYPSGPPKVSPFYDDVEEDLYEYTHCSEILKPDNEYVRWVDVSSTVPSSSSSSSSSSSGPHIPSGAGGSVVAPSSSSSSSSGPHIPSGAGGSVVAPSSSNSNNSGPHIPSGAGGSDVVPSAGDIGIRTRNKSSRTSTSYAEGSGQKSKRLKRG
jgi:hypothetical protein